MLILFGPIGNRSDSAAQGFNWHRHKPLGRMFSLYRTKRMRFHIEYIIIIYIAINYHENININLA